MSKESKTVVSEIKNLMVKFGFMKKSFALLVDGTEVRVDGDELVEGAAVYVVTEEGDVPAPDARHELEDGTIVETVGGLIVSVEVKEEAEEVKEEVIEESYEEEIKDEVEVKMEEEIKEEIKESLEEVIEEKEEIELEEEIKEDIAVKIADVMIPILEKVKELEEELTKVKASFNALSNEPAGKAITKVKKEFSGHSATDDMVSRILAMKNSK